MTLPASFLAAIESHACFTGCYSHETPVSMCVDTTRPPVTSYHVTCQDCLMFSIGSLMSQLPAGMTHYSLAQEASAHIRQVRGYRWAISGYHLTGQGFWLSAVYYGDGLFLVDGSRNSGSHRDVDLLVQAFRSKLVQPDDQGMLDPALYASEIVHLSCAPTIHGVRSKQDIVSSPQCFKAPRQGCRRVCIVEFLPLTSNGPTTQTSPAASSLSSAPAPKPISRTMRIGDVCPVCGAEVKERPLFVGSFVGCMC